MKVYWPIGVLEKPDPFWGPTQNTYESVTRWEEVEDCFRCWMVDHGMKFKQLLVTVCDLDLDQGDPDYMHTYEVTGELGFKGTLTDKEVFVEEIYDEWEQTRRERWKEEQSRREREASLT